MTDQPPVTNAPVHARGRLAYPSAAVSWLMASGEIVLDYGAGFGLLTQALVDLDLEVYAVDTSEALLVELRETLPDVPTAVATPDAIPLPEGSLEVVVSGQPVDLDSALPEIVRVLKPGGTLALAWTAPDQRIPWVRRLAGILGLPESPPDPSGLLADSELFAASEAETFSHWQQLDRDSVEDFALAHGEVSRLDERSQSRILREVGDLYAEYERGIDGLRLPYVTHCYRAVALIPPPPNPDEVVEEPPLIDFN